VHSTCPQFDRTVGGNKRALGEGWHRGVQNFARVPGARPAQDKGRTVQKGNGVRCRVGTSDGA